jgi:hypothetical protein
LTVRTDKATVKQRKLHSAAWLSQWLDLPMPGCVSRLIAVLTLVAFLTTNCYGLSRAQRSISACTCEKTHTDSETDCGDCDTATDSGCKHCQARVPQSGIAADASAKVEQTGQVFTAASSTRPCHGNDLPYPTCPCPGGCAFCSVAKVPCLLSPAPVLDTALSEGDGLDDAPPSYFPPFSGTLTRPPRI